LHEQAVEIALGPKGAFENGSVGTLTRRVTADRIVNAAATARRQAKPPGEPRTPRVIELLRKAKEWRRQLDAGEAETQAEIARREGITRARVTQVMGLLRLAPEIRQSILTGPAEGGRRTITERKLRSLVPIDDTVEQVILFRKLAATCDN